MYCTHASLTTKKDLNWFYSDWFCDSKIVLTQSMMPFFHNIKV